MDAQQLLAKLEALWAEYEETYRQYRAAIEQPAEEEKSRAPKS